MASFRDLSFCILLNHLCTFDELPGCYFCSVTISALQAPAIVLWLLLSLTRNLRCGLMVSQPVLNSRLIQVGRLLYPPPDRPQ